MDPGVMHWCNWTTSNIFLEFIMINQNKAKIIIFRVTHHEIIKNHEFYQIYDRDISPGTKITQSGHFEITGAKIQEKV